MPDGHSVRVHRNTDPADQPRPLPDHPPVVQQVHFIILKVCWLVHTSLLTPHSCHLPMTAIPAAASATLPTMPAMLCQRASCGVLASIFCGTTIVSPGSIPLTLR